jgi:kinesin family protein 11
MSTYTTGAASQLRSARQATQALLSDGTREDVPTGATPQKRRWVYTDKWDRTQTRGAGPSSLRTELATVAASATHEDEGVEEEDDPMDDGEDADAPVTAAEPESGSPASDVAPPPPYEDVAPKAKPAHSRTSSTASNTMPAPTRPTLAPAKRALSGLPKSASGTLTERPANVLTNRRRLR